MGELVDPADLKSAALCVSVRLRLLVPNYGFKVFMDAHSTVTAEEGDRYPLKPPKPTLGPLDVNGYDKGCSCRASG